MKLNISIIAIAAIVLTCTQTPTGPAIIPDFSITLSTTASSTIASITKIPDKASYESGDIVLLTVDTKTGYTFTGWTGDIVSSDDTVTLVMSTSKTVYANFKNSAGTTVYSFVTSTKNGSVTLAPSGSVYDSGTTVFVYARPDYGYKFLRWTGALSSSNRIDSIVVSGNVLVTANFVIDSNAEFKTLSISPFPVHGKITLNPPGIVSGNQHNYKPGITVAITVTPDTGYEFYAWGGDFSSMIILDTSISVILDSNRTITALFRKLPEGGTWTKHTSGIVNGLTTIIWAGNQLVAVGNGGAIVTSPDGLTWTSRPSGITSYCLNNVIWTGSLFVCVGDYGTILTSADGKVWEKKNSTTTYHLQSVAWTGTQFVAVGGYIQNSATNYSCLLTSPDGTTWKDHSSGSGIWYTLTWNGSKLVGAGFDYNYSTISDFSRSFIAVSTNGTTWEPCSTSIPVSASFISLAWTGSQFVAVGGCRNRTNALSSAYTSPDGYVWQEGTIPTSNFMRSVTWTGNTLIAVGDQGSIYNSYDGQIWNKCISNTTDAICGVTWTGTKLVAVGYGGMILTSP